MDAQLAAFVKGLRAQGCLPLPGEVGVVVGGPPCQGVSGLNRHASHVSILADPRSAPSPRSCYLWYLELPMHHATCLSLMFSVWLGAFAEKLLSANSHFLWQYAGNGYALKLLGRVLHNLDHF